jgi:hypothetical protein
MIWSQRILVADTDISPFAQEVGVETRQLQAYWTPPRSRSDWREKIWKGRNSPVRTSLRRASDLPIRASKALSSRPKRLGNLIR